MTSMGREDGWKRVAAQRLCPHTCNGHCNVWAQLKMALCLTLLFSIFLQATPADNQRLSFWVKNICNQLEQLKQDGGARNPFSIVGCNMTMICQYRDEDDCKQRTSTRLTVKRCFSSDNCTYDVKNMIIPKSKRTKCSIAVLFVNMSVDMQGTYYCEDRDFLDSENITAFLQRDIKVGYSPLKPVNISFVYQPQNSISVYLNPRNTSGELNTKTKWIAQYKWSDDNFTRCKSCQRQDIACKSHLAMGLCMPCSIKLSRYAGSGQYSNMGSIVLDFTVMVQVQNIYNVTDPVTVSTKLFDWVKPGPVHNVSQLNASDTSVHLKVVPPLKSIDDFHLRQMRRSHIPGQPPGCPLWLTYTVSPLSAKEQNLRTPESRLFWERYNIIRNLEDDQRAFEEVNDTMYNKTIQKCWDSSSNICPKTSKDPEQSESNEEQTALNPICFWLENLAHADFLYNVTFILHSRYPSDPVWTNISTAESVPMKSPAVDDNFAYCPADSQFSNDSCSRCLIYFKEIPQVWRGGRILSYSLTLELVNGSHLCGESNQTVWTNGNSNTFYVPNLSTASEYKITLIAHNKEGASPATVRKFVAQPSVRSSVAPRNVMVERGGNRYKLTWKDGPGVHIKGVNDTYFVHYCYANQLMDIPGVPNKSIEAQRFLNCLTNMVTRKVPVEYQDSYTFHEDIVTIDTASGWKLKPAFFVSILMEDGRKSGLVGVDCFYYENKYPRAGSLIIEKLDNDPTSLNIIVSSDCGDSVEYSLGRPEHFDLAKAKTDSDEQCSGDRCNKVAFLGYTPHRIENPKNPVVHRISDLDADTQYCIGIKIGQTWSCQVVKTAVKQNGLTMALSIAIPVSVIILAVVFVICCCAVIMPWYHRKAGKFAKSLFNEIFFDDKKDVKGLPDNTAASTALLALEGGQGVENPIFSYGTPSSFSFFSDHSSQSFLLRDTVRSTGRCDLTASRISLVHETSSCMNTNHDNTEENISSSCSRNQGEDDTHEENSRSESDNDSDLLGENTLENAIKNRYFEKPLTHADVSRGGSNKGSSNSHSINSNEDEEKEKDNNTTTIVSRYPAIDSCWVKSQGNKDSTDLDSELSENESEPQEMPRTSFNRYARHNTENSMKGSLASDVEDDGNSLCVETNDFCGKKEFDTSSFSHLSSAKMFNCESQSVVSLLRSSSSDFEIDNILKAADEENTYSPDSESLLKVAVPTLQQSISCETEIDDILNAATKCTVSHTPAPLTCKSKSNPCAADQDTLTQPDPSSASTLFVGKELHSCVPAAESLDNIHEVHSFLEAASLHSSKLSDTADASQKDAQEESKRHNLQNLQQCLASDSPKECLLKTFPSGLERADSVAMARQSTAVCLAETVETIPELCREMGKIPNNKLSDVGILRIRRAVITKSVEDILTAAGNPQTDLLSSQPSVQRRRRLQASHGSDRDSLSFTSGIDCDSESESCKESCDSSNENSGDVCALISSQTSKLRRPASPPATDTSLRIADLSHSSKTSVPCTDKLLSSRDKKIQEVNVGKKKLDALICKVPNGPNDSSDENTTPLQSEYKPLFTDALNSSSQGRSDKERLLEYENQNQEQKMYMKVTREETRL